jgi:hypothetical protein
MPLTERDKNGYYIFVLRQPKPSPSYVVVTQQDDFALARTPAQHERTIFLPPIEVYPENGAHLH